MGQLSWSAEPGVDGEKKSLNKRRVYQSQCENETGVLPKTQGPTEPPFSAKLAKGVSPSK